MIPLLEVMERVGGGADPWEGYRSLRGAQFSEAALAAANDLITNAKGWPSLKWRYMLQEAITTTDFPYLFGGILDRELLARYKAALPDWETYTPTSKCKDFRQKEIHKVQGNDRLLPLVAEKGEYLVSPMSDAHYHAQVYKRGRQFDISWESLINDDLGAFSDIAARFADSAIYTEAYVATAILAVAAGPNPALFGAPIADVDGQNVTNQGALALTIANLGTTLMLMSDQVDSQGDRLNIRGIHLVVPPRLELTARAILTSALVQQLASAVPVPVANVLTQMGIQLHVNPVLPLIDTSGNHDGTWYLLAEKAAENSHNWGQFNRLTGYETPEVCMKASDKVSAAGAALSPLSGDFATDNVFYRVRHVLGGDPLDPRFCYAQVNT